jgi:hypothetical protein
LSNDGPRVRFSAATSASGLGREMEKKRKEEKIF